MTRLLPALLALLLSGEFQDRAELRLPVDTWYRVVQGSRTVGYVHETLRRSAPPWRYEYSLDAEFELTIRGKPHAEDLLFTAFLDDTLSPVEVAAEGHADESATSLSLLVLGEERRIELRPGPSGDAAAWAQPARDEIFLLPSLTLYQLRQNETLSRPGRITLKAVDPRGQEKAGIEVVLEAEASVTRTYLGKEAAVVPVAFLKPFPGAKRETEWRRAFVDRFGRILEASMAGGAKMIIAADREEALDGIGILHRHGRRDPFEKATAMRNAAQEHQRAARGDLEMPAPLVTLDSLDSDLSAVRKLIEEIRAQKAAGDSEQARQTYGKVLVHLKAIRDLALRRRPALLPQIEQTRDDAETAWDGAAQVEREAGRLFVGAHDLMDRLDLEGLERTQKDLQALRDRIEVERRPERDRIAAWGADIGVILVKCRTRLDLVRAKLDVTGITLGEHSDEETLDARMSLFGTVLGAPVKVRVVRPVAMADVNGRLVRPGDLIEGTAIRVDKITSRSVQFSLRDEIRDVGLRR
jgi:hypothetical protein